MPLPLVAGQVALADRCPSLRGQWHYLGLLMSPLHWVVHLGQHAAATGSPARGTDRQGESPPLQLLGLASSCVIGDKGGWLLCWAFDDRASRVPILDDAMLEVPAPAGAAMLKPMMDEFEALDGDVESKRRVG